MARASRASWQRWAGLGVSRLGPYSGVLIWGAIILIFALIVPETFLTVQTARSVAADQAITAIMALAIICPLAAGVFDLSIAGMMGLAIVLVAYLQARAGVGTAPAILLTLLCGAFVGACNAFVVVRLRVDSFIATLGSSSILLAAIQWVTGGEQIFSGIPAGFTNLASKQLFTIPIPFFYMLVLAAVLWYVLDYRQTGRYLYATGSNPDAARLAGVRTDRLRAGSLVASATIASLAGIIFTAKIGSASPDSGGSYLLPAFAGAFLGATQIKSGRFNVPGTLLAVYLLATGVKGLQLAGEPNWVEDVFNGGALILAVAMAGLVERRVAGGRRRPAEAPPPHAKETAEPAS
jgi:ribose transport system permease protein